MTGINTAGDLRGGIEEAERLLGCLSVPQRSLPSAVVGDDSAEG